MNKMMMTLALAAAAAVPASPIEAQTPTPPTLRVQTEPGRLIFYNQPNFNGEEMEIDSLRRIFRWDYNIRSIAIHPGDRWELCAQPRFSGCIVLDRSIPDATMVGITASIGSVRPAPAPAPSN